jgi:type II secretory pathway component GspD/PulD (secretin)
VGDNVPVPTADTAGSTNPLRTSQTIERRDVGIDLRVEPTVPADGPLVLKLRVEVSAIGPAIDAGSTFLERTLEATVRLAPDQEAVIGWVGLPRTAVSVVGTPFLMRVPILGALFRRTVDVEMSTYTMILVRASRNRPDADLLIDSMRREMAVRRGEVAAGSPASP